MTGQAHHVTPPRVYFIAYIFLLVALVATYGVYAVGNQYHLNAALALGIAMVIAVAKALVVVLFFMQVKYSSRLTWMWAALGFAWLFFMAGILVDYQSRSMNPDGQAFDTNHVPNAEPPAEANPFGKPLKR